MGMKFIGKDVKISFGDKIVADTQAETNKKFDQWWLAESPPGTFDKEQARLVFIAAYRKGLSDAAEICDSVADLDLIGGDNSGWAKEAYNQIMRLLVR